MLPSFFKRNLVDGIVETKYSFIVGYGIIIGIMVCNRHIAQSLIAAKRHLCALSVARTRAAADKSLVHQVLGFVVLAFFQQPLDFGQRFQSLGVAVVARCATP